MEPIAYGITGALVWLKYSLFTSHYYLYELFRLKERPHIEVWMVELGTLFTLIYVIGKILEEGGKLNDKKLITLLALSVVLLGFISFEIGGLVLGIVLLLIGFAHAHHLLTGLGVFTSLVFLSNYYYYTGETLMEKAGLLALLGVGLLISRFVMKMVLKREVKDV